MKFQWIVLVCSHVAHESVSKGDVGLGLEKVENPWHKESSLMLIYDEKCDKYCFNFTDTVLQMCQHHVSNISITMNIYVQLTFLILKKLNVMAYI
jgi:hypothetical protein